MRFKVWASFSESDGALTCLKYAHLRSVALSCLSKESTMLNRVVANRNPQNSASCSSGMTATISPSHVMGFYPIFTDDLKTSQTPRT